MARESPWMTIRHLNRIDMNTGLICFLTCNTQGKRHEYYWLVSHSLTCPFPICLLPILLIFSPPLHLGGFYFVSNTGLQRPQLASTTDLSSLSPSSTVLPIILQTPEVVLRSNLHFPHSACLLYMSPALFNTHTHTINTWSYCILIIVQGCSMVRPQPSHYESYDYHWCRAAFLSLATSTAAMLESNRMAAPTHLQEWQQKGHSDNQYTALSPGSASVRHTNQPGLVEGEGLSVIYGSH